MRRQAARRLTGAEARRRRFDARGKPYILSAPPDDDPEVVARRLVREGELYDLFEERWALGHRGRPGEAVEVRVARNKAGDYVGDERDARFLCDQLGIAPERRTEESGVCSHGWSDKKKRWYGWSHRAIHGFREGDSVGEGSVVERGTVGHDGLGYEPGHVLASDEEARQAARLFAAEVS